MKLQSTKTWLIVSVVAAGLQLAASASRAQAPKEERRSIDSKQTIQLIQQAKTLAESKSMSGARVRISLADSIRTAAAAVNDAKGDEAKAAAQKTLNDLLSKYFDDDMVRREQELKQIEERLTKLRELLDRRRAKKQDIVELQIKVALNEEDGLGFYDNDLPGGGKPGFFRPSNDWGRDLDLRGPQPTSSTSSSFGSSVELPIGPPVPAVPSEPAVSPVPAPLPRSPR